MYIYAHRWHKYNRGMRMVWEAHLALYLAASDAKNENNDTTDVPVRAFPSSTRLPHVVVAWGLLWDRVGEVGQRVRNLDWTREREGEGECMCGREQACATVTVPTRQKKTGGTEGGAGEWARFLVIRENRERWGRDRERTSESKYVSECVYVCVCAWILINNHRIQWFACSGLLRERETERRKVWERKTMERVEEGETCCILFTIKLKK